MAPEAAPQEDAPDSAAPRPLDHASVHDFLIARRAQAAELMPQVCAGGGLAEVLENAWISEWFNAHYGRIIRALQATEGLDFEALDFYIQRGGLQQCVADNIQLFEQQKALRSRIRQLETALSGIARVSGGDADQDRRALDRMRLMAYEAVTGLKAEDAPAEVEPQATPAEHEDDDALADQVLAALVQDAVPDGTDDSAPATLQALPPRAQVFTAERFVAMAGIRGLTIHDGDAFASDGETFDENVPIDPSMPLPMGVKHVYWKEFAAA